MEIPMQNRIKSIDTSYTKNSFVSNKEHGEVHGRTKRTVGKRKVSIQYVVLTRAEFLQLKDALATIPNLALLQFVEPGTLQAYTVVITKGLEYSVVRAGDNKLYQATIQVTEI